MALHGGVRQPFDLVLVIGTHGGLCCVHREGTTATDTNNRKGKARFGGPLLCCENQGIDESVQLLTKIAGPSLITNTAREQVGTKS